MHTTEAIPECKSCGTAGAGNYCASCGEPYRTHRITLGHMLYEVAHLLTHFDKGFAYTLKRLITAPGNMQLEYIDGSRKRYQKPFSMFFLCSTISALAVYWISVYTGKRYGSQNTAEMHFFQHYFVFLQMALVPVYALINRIAYYNTKYNYAEFLVILLYNTSFIFLILPIISSVKLVAGDLETGYIEMIFVLGYNILTYLKFFRDESKAATSIKVIITSAACFALSRFCTETFITMFLE